jgi:hypothetical protein
MQCPPERSWSWPFRKTITDKISSRILSEVCSHARLRGKSLLTVAPASVLELETILIEIIEGWDFVFATVIPCPPFLFYIIAFCLWRRLLIIDRLTYEFCAEAINISQRLETWLPKKSENVFLNPTDPFLVGFQQKRRFKRVELRPLYLYDSAIHKSL